MKFCNFLLKARHKLLLGSFNSLQQQADIIVCDAPYTTSQTMYADLQPIEDVKLALTCWIMNEAIGLRHIYRYHAVLLRAEFDATKDEVDMVKTKQLLLQGEAQLRDNMHPQPIKFANSPGGTAYGREIHIPDWYLDMWHPLERAQYPDYFARREQRKLEYLQNWEKKYGKPEPDGAH